MTHDTAAIQSHAVFHGELETLGTAFRTQDSNNFCRFTFTPLATKMVPLFPPLLWYFLSNVYAFCTGGRQ